MPRRIPDYPDAYAGFNAIASFGSYLSAISGIFFFYIVYISLTQGRTDFFQYKVRNVWRVRGNKNS